MTLSKGAIITAVILLVFAIGRYTTPTKTITETKIVEVDKKTDDIVKQLNKHKKVTITDITRPDGTKERKTIITEDTSKSSDEHKTEDTAKSSSERKEVIKSSDPVTLSALAGAPISLTSGLGSPIFGASLTKPVLGPITLGVWGLSNLTGGFSLGVTF